MEYITEKGLDKIAETVVKAYTRSSGKCLVSVHAMIALLMEFQHYRNSEALERHLGNPKRQEEAA